MRTIPLFCSIAIITGCFLPWIQIGALLKNNGIDNPDAIIILVAGILSLATSVTSKKKNALFYFILAIACLAVSIVDYKEVKSRGELVTVGTGIYVIFIGAGLLALSSLIDLFTSEKLDSIEKEKPGKNEFEIVAPKNLKEKTEEEIENEKYKQSIINLNAAILKENKKLWGGSFNDDIENQICILAKNKSEFDHLLFSYKALLNRDLLNDLKELSGSKRMKTFFNRYS